MKIVKLKDKEFGLLTHIVDCWYPDESSDISSKHVVKEKELLKQLKDKLFCAGDN
jgi:hypothetical protein